MKAFLSALWETFKQPESIIVLIGILVALINAYYSVRDESTQQALYAILSVLGSLAIAQLISKYSSIKSEKAIQYIKEKLQIAEEGNVLLQTRKGRPHLSDEAGDAKELLIIGRTLSMILRDKEYFLERLNDKSNIRLVMVNYENEELIKTMTPTLEAPNITDDIRTALGYVRQIMTEKRDGNLQLRCTSYAPTLSMLVVDPKKDSGYIVVELLPYKEDPINRPHFVLRKKSEQHKQWFEYFYKLAERIWKDATEIDINSIK